MSTHDFDPASRSRLALFKKPFYTDWTVLLGAIAVGVPAWDTGQKYPAIWNGSTADFIGVSIDAGLSTLFQIVVFCFAPAAIRRRWGKFWQAACTFATEMAEEAPMSARTAANFILE